MTLLLFWRCKWSDFRAVMQWCCSAETGWGLNSAYVDIVGRENRIVLEENFLRFAKILHSETTVNATYYNFANKK